jgi:hypothetical protein
MYHYLYLFSYHYLHCKINIIAAKLSIELDQNYLAHCSRKFIVQSLRFLSMIINHLIVLAGTPKLIPRTSSGSTPALHSSSRTTTMTAHFYSLPRELVDLCIDKLQEDDDVESREALRASSLVCRAFYPRSRAHLFKHISFSGQALPTLMARLCSLVDVMKSPYGTGIAPYIKAFEIIIGVFIFRGTLSPLIS